MMVTDCLRRCRGLAETNDAVRVDEGDPICGTPLVAGNAYRLERAGASLLSRELVTPVGLDEHGGLSTGGWEKT